MAGEARTSSFLLSTATVMIGPQANIRSFNPTANSIGLVENFSVSGEPSLINLTQGVSQDVVMSVKNNHNVRATMGVREFTVRNLAYALGKDGSNITYNPVPNLWASKSAIAAAATTAVVVGDITTDIAVGDFLFIQEGDNTDYVHLVKVATRTFATGDTTITFAAGFAVPAGVSFSAGARIGKMVGIPVGGLETQPDLAARVIGNMPKDGRPVIIDFPKIKITKGFEMAFQPDQYGNLPFEFTPYALMASDALYAEYGSRLMRLYSAG